MTRPGTMQDRVTLQRNTPTASAYGENADSWATVETLYAEVVPLSSFESGHAGQPVGQVSYRVTVRHRPRWSLNYISGGPIMLLNGQPLTGVEGRYRPRPGDRWVYRTKALEITGVEDVHEHHRYTRTTAREVIA